MLLTKPINKSNASTVAVPEPTMRTYVHAAVVASLIVTIFILVDLCFMALSDHQRGFLLLELLLVPYATLVVWSTATVFYLGVRVAGLLGKLKRPVKHVRSSPSGNSGVWDDWLDIPDPRYP
jgi:hypothetical protein